MVTDFRSLSAVRADQLSSGRPPLLESATAHRRSSCSMYAAASSSSDSCSRLADRIANSSLKMVEEMTLHAV